jgi:hypothetical protein
VPKCKAKDIITFFNMKEIDTLAVTDQGFWESLGSQENK